MNTNDTTRRNRLSSIFAYARDAVREISPFPAEEADRIARQIAVYVVAGDRIPAVLLALGSDFTLQLIASLHRSSNLTLSGREIVEQD